jgi:predicted transposase YbfD/YdcC
MGIFERLRCELQVVDDVSGHNGYWYSVSDALIMLITGTLCGLRTVMDIHEWACAKPARTFLKEQFDMDEIMSKSQFYNILAIVNAEEFKRSFVRWMQGVLGRTVVGKTVAIDGKIVCGTDKLTKDGSILNIISAYAAELKMTIGSHECMSKPGERDAFRELLTMLELTDTIVVADALHCNKPTIKAIIKAKADYLLVVKDNTPSLKQGIQTCLGVSGISSATTQELNGGRRETRTAYTANDLSGLNHKSWPNLKVVGAINRQFEKGGKVSNEWHYYISSKTLTPQELLHHARMEWSIESMHWLLDVHFAEDKTRIYDMNVQKILNIVRKIALNLIQIYKTANHKPRTPLSSIMRANLFDPDILTDFLEFFRVGGELE